MTNEDENENENDRLQELPLSAMRENRLLVVDHINVLVRAVNDMSDILEMLATAVEELSKKVARLETTEVQMH